MTKKQRFVIYVSSLAIMLLFFFILFGDKGVIDLNKKKGLKNELVKKNQVLRQEISSLYIEIGRAENDPVYIEAMARNKLGMIGKDELIIQLNQDTKK